VVLGAVVGACAGGCSVGVEEVLGAGAEEEPVGAAAAEDVRGAGAAGDVSDGLVWARVAAEGVGAGAVDAALPGRACAYPPASTTAPAADATVIHPVAVRTLRSPRSRAPARSRAVSSFLGDKVGLLGGGSSGLRSDTSLARRRFGTCKPDVQKL
jgi:hypothetical protein